MNPEQKASLAKEMSGPFDRGLTEAKKATPKCKNSYSNPTGPSESEGLDCIPLLTATADYVRTPTPPENGTDLDNIGKEADNVLPLQLSAKIKSGIGEVSDALGCYLNTSQARACATSDLNETQSFVNQNPGLSLAPRTDAAADQSAAAASINTNSQADLDREMNMAKTGFDQLAQTAQTARKEFRNGQPSETDVKITGNPFDGSGEIDATYPAGAYAPEAMSESLQKGKCKIGDALFSKLRGKVDYAGTDVARKTDVLATEVSDDDLAAGAAALKAAKKVYSGVVKAELARGEGLAVIGAAFGSGLYKGFDDQNAIWGRDRTGAQTAEAMDRALTALLGN